MGMGPYYNLSDLNKEVTVNFSETAIIVGNKELPFYCIYCTITVKKSDGKITHYHAGTVCNPHDSFNRRTGYFIAFKRALRQRWDEEHRLFSECVWKQYHKRWAHYLADLMDRKVDDEDGFPF